MKKIKEFLVPLAIIVSMVLFSVAITAAALIISNTEFEIESQTASTTTEGGITNAITVNGIGEVSAKPDIANISATISEEGKNIEDARKKVDEKVKGLINELNKKGVNKDDIKTNRYTMYPSTRWRDNATVSQSLNIKVTNIDSNEDKLSEVIKAMSDYGGNSDWWYGWNINYDIEDKTEFYSQARKLAYAKAEQKAKELANLSDVKLDKPVTISENSSDSFESQAVNNHVASRSALSNSSAETSMPTIPTGEIKITVNLSVSYEID